jgi:hypothetical protein
MKIRAILNGNILDEEEVYAAELIATGLFEALPDEEEVEEESGTDEPKAKRTYKRRDMKPEK